MPYPHRQIDRIGRCRSARDVAPRDVLVDPRFAGQPEDPLADDVPLRLVRSAGDAVTGGAEDVLAPRERAPLTGVGDEPRPEQRRDDVAGEAHALRPQQLAERAFGSGSRPGPTQVGGTAV